MSSFNYVIFCARFTGILEISRIIFLLLYGFCTTKDQRYRNILGIKMVRDGFFSRKNINNTLNKTNKVLIKKLIKKCKNN